MTSIQNKEMEFHDIPNYSLTSNSLQRTPVHYLAQTWKISSPHTVSNAIPMLTANSSS